MLQDVKDENTRSSFEPIQYLADSKRALEKAEGKDYARHWMQRALFTEVTKRSIEDHYVDVGSEKLRVVIGAIKELQRTSEWMHPAFVRAMTALKGLSSLASERFTMVRQSIDNVPIIERVAEGKDPFQISNRGARVVPIMEDSLGDPQTCALLTEAFVKRLDVLKSNLGITHLLFIEKEIGPVGALPIMAALVAGTRLPACVFRESFDQLQPSLNPPGPKSRLAIVYDMIVSGEGIKNVADRVRADVGAPTVAAVVLRGYGSRVQEVRTLGGQTIKLETLSWDKTEDSTYPSLPSRVDSEAPNGSGGATPQEERMSDSEHTIAPGTYTRENFPEISEGARAILARVRAAASQKALSHTSGGARRLKDSGTPLGIRLKDSGTPLGVKGIK
jgi:hypothetical protein